MTDRPNADELKEFVGADDDEDVDESLTPPDRVPEQTEDSQDAPGLDVQPDSDEAPDGSQ